MRTAARSALLQRLVVGDADLARHDLLRSRPLSAGRDRAAHRRRLVPDRRRPRARRRAVVRAHARASRRAETRSRPAHARRVRDDVVCRRRRRRRSARHLRRARARRRRRRARRRFPRRGVQAAELQGRSAARPRRRASGDERRRDGDERVSVRRAARRDADALHRDAQQHRLRAARPRRLHVRPSLVLARSGAGRVDRRPRHDRDEPRRRNEHRRGPGREHAAVRHDVRGRRGDDRRVERRGLRFKTFTALPSGTLLGVKADDVGTAGSPLGVDLVATDPNGRARAGTRVHLELQAAVYATRRRSSKAPSSPSSRSPIATAAGARRDDRREARARRAHAAEARRVPRSRDRRRRGRGERNGRRRLRRRDRRNRMVRARPERAHRQARQDDVPARRDRRPRWCNRRSRDADIWLARRAARRAVGDDAAVRRAPRRRSASPSRRRCCRTRSVEAFAVAAARRRAAPAGAGERARARRVRAVRRRARRKVRHRDGTRGRAVARSPARVRPCTSISPMRRDAACAAR